MQLLLVDLHFEAVHVLADRGEFLPQFAPRRDAARPVPGSGASAPTPAAANCTRAYGERPVDRVEHGGEGIQHASGGLHLCPPDDGPARRLLGRGTFGLPLPRERTRRELCGAHPFLGGLQRETRLHLGLPGGLELDNDRVPGRDVQDGPRRRYARLQLRLGPRAPPLRPLRRFSGRGEAALEPLALRATPSRACTRARFSCSVWAASRASNSRSAAIAACELLLASLELIALLGEREPRPFDDGRDLGQARPARHRGRRRVRAATASPRSRRAARTR